MMELLTMIIKISGCIGMIFFIIVMSVKFVESDISIILIFIATCCIALILIGCVVIGCCNGDDAPINHMSVEEVKEIMVETSDPTYIKNMRIEDLKQIVRELNYKQCNCIDKERY